MELWALLMTGVCSASAIAVFLLNIKGLGSGSGRRSDPKKQARAFLGTLNALSLPLWPLFQR
jgi:hypothetical protein